MKKTLLIAVGILIACIVIGVWAYLFIYGTPKNSSEVFTRFGIGGEAVVPTTNTNTTIDVTSETTEGAPQKLKQLTTRAVAGASFTESGIRYVEQGTGHIYEINLESGAETLISGTTITQTTAAIFGTGGEYVAITSRTFDGDRTVVGALSQASSTFESGIALPNGASEISFGNSTGTVFYALKDSDGTSGYAYDINKRSGSPVFSIALRDVHVLWGAPIHVYTTPTNIHEGYAYRVEKNDLKYVSAGSYGLSALTYENGLIITGISESKVKSINQRKSGEIQTIPLPLIPEKCVPNPVEKSRVYCGVPQNLLTTTYPDAWYVGSIAYSDILWDIDVENDEAAGLADFATQSGRQIDIAKIGTDREGKNIYFINKNDNSLWIFDTSL